MVWGRDWVQSRVWCKESQGTASRGWVNSPQEGWSKESSLLLYIGPTNSGKASKALVSKSDCSLSCHRANSASTAKSSFFTIAIEQNALAKSTNQKTIDGESMKTIRPSLLTRANVSQVHCTCIPTRVGIYFSPL